MVHFFTSKVLSASVERQDAENCLLKIQVRFTLPSQQDGHGPMHGDLDRDYTEVLLNNLDQVPIVAALSDAQIGSVGKIKEVQVAVRPVGKLCPDNFMPLLDMDLKIRFQEQSDPVIAAASTLLSMVPWDVAKKAIFEETLVVREF